MEDVVIVELSSPVEEGPDSLLPDDLEEEALG